MTKWDKVINQIINNNKDTINLTYRQRRMYVKGYLKNAMRQRKLPFKEFLAFKNWDKSNKIILKNINEQ